MEEILEAKIESCPEFKQALVNSVGKRLVVAVKSDIFWSSGLNPRDAESTKPQFYPGQNHLGSLLEHIRTNMLLGKKGINCGESTSELNKSLHDCGASSDTISPSPNDSYTTNMEFTFTKPTLLQTSVADVHSAVTTVPLSCSPTFNAPSLTTNPHASSVQAPGTSSVLKPTMSLDLLEPSIPEGTGVLASSSADKESVSHGKAGIINISSQISKPAPKEKHTTNAHPKIQKKTKSSSKYSDNVPSLQEQFMASWVKRKLSPEKEADTTTASKQSRSDSGGK